MLVLEREIQESININDDIEIKILKVSRIRGTFKVRLGINAPRNIIVHRSEIYKLIQQEKQFKESAHGNGNK